MITDYYSDRMIIYPPKFERLFKMQLNAFVVPYNNMLRIHEADSTFDPGINRCFESLRCGRDERSTQGQKVKNDARTENTNRQLIWDGPETVTENYTDDRGARQNVRTTEYDNVRDVNVRTGSIQENGEDNGFQKDGEGSSMTVAKQSNLTTATQNLGTHTTVSENTQAGRTVGASRVAPMTNVNLMKNSGIVSATGTVKDGSAAAQVVLGTADDGVGQNDGMLGHQNWANASSVNEGSSLSGTSQKQTESFDGFGNNVTVSGSGDDNKDVTSYNRSTNTQDKSEKLTSYNSLTDDKVRTGAENVTENAQAYTDKHGGTRITEKAGNQNVTNGKVTTISSDTDSGTEQAASVGSNKYSGRENLTPQAAFRTALAYLEEYPTAINWLIGKLSSCFINNIWEEQYYGEYDN